MKCATDLSTLRRRHHASTSQLQKTKHRLMSSPHQVAPQRQTQKQQTRQQMIRPLSHDLLLYKPATWSPVWTIIDTICRSEIVCNLGSCNFSNDAVYVAELLHRQRTKHLRDRNKVLVRPVLSILSKHPYFVLFGVGQIGTSAGR